MMPKPPRALAGKIRTLREANRWTQSQLGIKIGRHQSRIAKWEMSSGEPTPADLLGLVEGVRGQPTLSL